MISGRKSSISAVLSGSSIGLTETAELVLTANAIAQLQALIGSGASLVQAATGTLTSAQIKNMNATPVQIIAAPGAGKAINVIECFLQFKFGTIAYTNAGEFGLIYNGDFSNDNFAFNSNTSFITGNVSAVGGMGFYEGSDTAGIGVAQSLAANSAVMIAKRNAPEFATGDGTLVVTVYYTVVTLQ